MIESDETVWVCDCGMDFEAIADLVQHSYAVHGEVAGQIAERIGELSWHSPDAAGNGRVLYVDAPVPDRSGAYIPVGVQGRARKTLTSAQARAMAAALLAGADLADDFDHRGVTDRGAGL